VMEAKRRMGAIPGANFFPDRCSLWPWRGTGEVNCGIPIPFWSQGGSGLARTAREAPDGVIAAVEWAMNSNWLLECNGIRKRIPRIPWRKAIRELVTAALWSLLDEVEAGGFRFGTLCPSWVLRICRLPNLAGQLLFNCQNKSMEHGPARRTCCSTVSMPTFHSAMSQSFHVCGGSFLVGG